jgi:signal transduction histidine kinase/putative methionine-R-sulfoxide reductase with GAF domain
MKPHTMAKELPALHEIAELFLDTNISIPDFLKRVLRKAGDVISSDLSFIGLVEESEGEQWVVLKDPAKEIIGAEYGEWQNYLGRVRVGSEELPSEERSFVGAVAYTKKARRSGNVKNETFYRNSNDKIQSEIAAPVLFHDEILAVINLESKTPDSFSETHEHLLLLIAKLIALPLHSLMVAEGRRRPSVEVLAQVAECVSSSPSGIPLETTDALHKIAEVLAVSLHSGLCQIWILHGDKDLSLWGRFAQHDLAITAGIYGEKYAWKAMNEKCLLKPGHSYTHSTDDDHRVPFMVAPMMMISGKPLGAIVVGYRHTGMSDEPGYYTGADEQLIQSVQAQISGAIEFKRSEAARREESYSRSRQLSKIAEIFAELDLAIVLEKTVHKVPQICNGRFCSVFLWDEDKKQFVLAESNAKLRKQIGIAAYSPREGLTGWVGHHGKALVLDNRVKHHLAQIAPDLVWKSKFSEFEETEDLTFHAFAAVPIFRQGRVIGVLRLSGSTTGSPFSEHDESVMKFVADKISTAIAYSEQYEERIRLLRGLRDLMAYAGQFPRNAASIDDFKQDFLKKAVVLARKVFKADIVIIYSVKGESLEYPPVWAGDLYREDMMETPLGPHDVPPLILAGGASRFWSDALSEKDLVGKINLESASGSRQRFVEREKIVSSAGVRLKVAETAVGVMFLNYRNAWLFGLDQRNLMEAFGTQVALCLETAALYAHVKETASREEAFALAYELHDAGTAMQFGVVFQAGKILDHLISEDNKYIQSGGLLAALRSLEKNAANSMVELGVIMGDLQGPDTDALSWDVRLKDYIEESKRPGLEIDYQIGEGIQLSAHINRHLYLIGRELYSNVLEHSGAQRVSIRAEIVSGGRLTLAVEDDGKGFVTNTAKESSSLGLKSIARRVDSLKGTFEINSKPGKGTLATVSLSLEAAASTRLPLG